MSQGGATSGPPSPASDWLALASVWLVAPPIPCARRNRRSSGPRGRIARNRATRRPIRRRTQTGVRPRHRGSPPLREHRYRPHHRPHPSQPRTKRSRLLPPAAPSMARVEGGTFHVGGTVTVRAFLHGRHGSDRRRVRGLCKLGQCRAEHVGESSADGTSFKADVQCNYGVPDRANHPMNCVDWGSSATYCRAQGKRLPTEEEWQWASRGGSEGRPYPWGSVEPGSQPCWSRLAKRNGTCPVGSNPAGDAPGGVHDLLGNVWEWTESAFSIWPTTSRSRRHTGPHRSWRRLEHDGPIPLDRRGPQLAAPRRAHRQPRVSVCPGLEAATPVIVSAKWRDAIENYVAKVRRDNQALSAWQPSPSRLT